MTYFLRFKDDMKEEDSEETHVASTKQLNIRLEKGKEKKQILFSSCYIFEITYKYQVENIFAVFCTLQTNQIYQNRIRRIKEKLDFPKISPFRLNTHNSGLDSASCFNSSK